MDQSGAVTYEVRDLLEMTMIIPTGCGVRPQIEIPFTGGQVTGYGVSPARYVTRDPCIQRMIESTVEFRKGKIKRVPKTPFNK